MDRIDRVTSDGFQSSVKMLNVRACGSYWFSNYCVQVGHRMFSNETLASHSYLRPSRFASRWLQSDAPAAACPEHSTGLQISNRTDLLCNAPSRR